MAEPFLAIDNFDAEYGGLTAGERSQATRLLTGLSDHIRDKKPDVDPVRAAQVVFEVVRDAIKFGDLEKFESFLNTTSRRTESGTFNEAALSLDDYLNTRQKRYLGIAEYHPSPSYRFD